MRFGSFEIDKDRFILLLIVAICAAGLAIGVMWAYESLEAKWFAAAVVILVVVWGALLLHRHLESFLLYLFCFILPVDPDFHFSYEKITAGCKGLSLSASDTILCVLFLIWFLKLLNRSPEKRSIRMLPMINIPFMALIGWYILFAFHATDSLLSVFEIVQWIKTWFLFLYLANNLEEKHLVGMGLGFCAGVLLQGPITFGQYFMGKTFDLQIFGETKHSLVVQNIGDAELSRVGGTLGHPNGLSLFLSVMIPFVAAFGFSTKSRWALFLSSVTLMVGVGALVLSFARGGWLTVGIALPCVIFLAAWKKWGFYRAFMILIIVAILMVIVIIPFWGSIAQRLFEEDYGRGYSRVPLMEVALHIIKRHPFLGVGLNNYMLVMSDYDNTLEQITLHVPNPVHNLFLLMAAETGIPSLFFFLWLNLAILKQGWAGFRKGKTIGNFFCLGAIGSLFSFILHSQVNFNYVASNYYFALVAGLSGASAFWQKEEKSV